MQLTELRIHNLRCLQQVHINPAPGINIIIGDNGSGKTSLLEAIHLLARARSFRDTSNQRLITDKQTTLSVFARIQADGQRPYSIGVSRQDQAMQFRLSSVDNARVIDLVRALPAQVISPGLHALLERGPAQRRRFMDWGVFHVEPDFFAAWQRYHRALRQRNAALRKRSATAAITVWDEALVQAAEVIHEQRGRHIEALQDELIQVINDLGLPDAGLDYQRGWPAEHVLGEHLRASIERDMRAGYTGTGPHRADLRLSWAGRNALDTASRGEQKLLVSLLLIRQAQYVGRATRRQPLLLVDDMAAELGPGYRDQLLKAVADSRLQSFVTFLESSQLPGDYREAQMFHVKHGVVAPGVAVAAS